MEVDFTKILSTKFITSYLMEVFSKDTVSNLLASDSKVICQLFMTKWKQNESLNNSPLIYEIDLFIILLSHKLMKAKNEQDMNTLCNCIQYLCNWCETNSVLFTKSELNVLLIGLFYQNYEAAANHTIQDIMSHSKIEIVSFL